MTASGSAVAPLRDGDPERIGPYAVVGVLGAGGMGRVYLGRDDRGRPAAVKVIRPELATDPAFRVRFRGEVEAARRVPARVTAQVLDADAEADRPWVATRYLPGPSLDHQVRAHGPLSGRPLRRVAAGLLDGLVAVHGAGLVHRDLKPSNVLLTRRGPRIIDFGIARAADRTRITTTGRLVGTPAYMSPEQALGDGPVGPAGDVHALGSVLVFAATGHAPFAAPSAAAVLFRVLHGEPDLGGTPEPVRGWAARCLARDPADRPSPETLRAELRRPARRRAVVVAGGLMAAAVVGGVLLWPGPPSGSGASATASPTPAPATAGPAVDPRVPGAGPAVTTVPDRPAATVSAEVDLGHRGGRVVAGVGRVYVADPESGAVDVRDPSGAAVGRVDVGRFPSALALSPDGTRLFVTLSTSPTRVLAVDTATLRVTARADVAPEAADASILRAAEIRVAPDGGSVIVLDPRSRRVLALDPDTLRVRATRVLPGEPASLTSSPDGARIAVAAGDGFSTGTVTVLDGSTLEPTGTSPSGADPAGFADDGRVLYLADSRPGADPGLSGVQFLGPGSGPSRLALDAPDRLRLGPGGGWLYVTRPDAGELVVVATSTRRVVATVPAPGIEDVAVAPDGRAAYVVAGGTLRVLTG